MAGVTSKSSIESNEMEVTIYKLLQMRTLPIIVKTALHQKREGFFGHQGMPENKEILLKRTILVKYAHIKLYKSDDEGRDMQDCDDIGDNHYLLPVKYHGKLKYVHRPGSRKRYASISQVLHDLPRFIIIWENIQATLSCDENELTTVEAGTRLELVRKFRKPGNHQTFLEFSYGETAIAFSDNERLNCTAIDDSKQYNLFELVRSKLLPRFIQFDEVDLNDITHVNDTLYNETLSAVCQPVELLGFTDIEMLVGYIRNEINETYETVLIPWDLWTSIYVHTEYSGRNEQCKTYISRLYEPVGEVDFIEKSLYLLPIHQRHIVCLIGPDFKRNFSRTNIVDPEPDDLNEMTYQGPVVLLPQVKKKKTLFRKVHRELLRLFKSSDEKTAAFPLKNQRKTDRIKTKHYTKDIQGPVSKNTPLSEMRKEPMCLRKKYGNASYLEFHDDNSIGQLPGATPVQLRLSLSLGDLPNAVFRPIDESYNNTNEPITSLNNLQQTSKEYAEIRDIPRRNEEVSIYDTPCPGRQRCVHPPLLVSTSAPIIQGAKINVSFGEYWRNEQEREIQNRELFYSYNVSQTYHCFKHCGLEELAVKCKKHKLDGSFFRNFDCSHLKDDPFNLSNFTILKVKKIIYDGWRPT